MLLQTPLFLCTDALINSVLLLVAEPARYV
jgi:hypothetical protein